jgi:dTDP-4-amino-4,6-dideoxygalactose transaminase
LSMSVPLARPDVGDLELQYVTEVLQSGMLSLGPTVPKFESKFASFVGRKHAIAVNSGTSALHLCVRALGIGPDDEVVTSSFSFVASTNCILYEGGVPVFVDVDPDTFNLSPEQIHRFLSQRCELDAAGACINKETGRRVKAILPVHVFGLPCDMDAIERLAQEYGLSVIEDACEALGADYRGRRAGSFGDASCFAFYPNKQMTTAEGGMIVTDDDAIAEACSSMRNQGRNSKSEWLDHARLGFNYRLSDIHAALGLAQLERINTLLERRRDAAASYGKKLRGITGLSTPKESNGSARSWFVYVVQLASKNGSEQRDQVLNVLRSSGIGCQAYFPAIHRQPYMKDLYFAPFGKLRETEIASDQCLAIPFFSTISSAQISSVCHAIRQAVRDVITPDKFAIHAAGSRR